VREPMVVAAGESELVGDRWAGGGPVAVLLHAGVADRRSFYEVAEALAGPLTVVAYDRRGYGGSAPSPDSFSHVDDLLAVLDVVGDGPVWLVGSSMGGGLALDAALVAPDRVAGLVLLAPAVSGAPEPASDPVLDQLENRKASAIASGDLAVINEAEISLWLDGPAGPEGRVAGERRRLALEMNAVVLAYDVLEDTGASGVDAWGRLDEVLVPVTVGCGDLDVSFLVARSLELARRLPRGRHQVLEGMAHLPYLEDPLGVARLISDAVTGR